MTIGVDNDENVIGDSLESNKPNFLQSQNATSLVQISKNINIVKDIRFKAT